MDIEYDPAKRLQTLESRGLDMNDASLLFDGLKVTILDDRKDYGEQRWITFGYLRQRIVLVVWTPRGSKTSIISMRKANDREVEIFSGRMA